MRHTPEFEDCFARLIALPSVSSIDPRHDQSNRAVVDLLAEWFGALQFDCDVITVDEATGKYNLVATRGGGTGGLVLSGHTDTVPYDVNGWDTDPFKLTKKNGNYYGLGTADMKSYFPIILEALERMQDIQFNKPITIVATADEESTMSGARLLSDHKGLQGDYCIIGEPTGLKPVYSHKGIIIESFRIEGRSGHSSNPALGNSALEGMHRVMTALLQWRQELQARYVDDAYVVPVPTMNLGRIHGGDSPNRICAECELSLDLRMMPGMDAEELRAQLRDQVRKTLRDSGLKLEFTSKVDIVPPMLTPLESDIVGMCEKATGNKAACVTFGTEGPFFNDMGISTVILGPGDIDVAHQPNEYLQIDRIEPMITILSRLLMHFCEGKS